MQRKYFAFGIAWFLLVTILLIIPGNELPKPQTWLEEIFFDKWIHAFLFGFLAYLFMHGLHKKSKGSKRLPVFFLSIFLLCSAWGLLTEMIQEQWIKGRGFEWLDWIADTTGALIAFIYCTLRLKLKDLKNINQ